MADAHEQGPPDGCVGRVMRVCPASGEYVAIGGARIDERRWLGAPSSVLPGSRRASILAPGGAARGVRPTVRVAVERGQLWRTQREAHGRTSSRAAGMRRPHTSQKP